MGIAVFYVGHVSFEGPEPEFKTQGRGRGWFTLLAETESVDEAVDRFRELVESLKSWFTSFEDVESVFLDDITEVERLPREGVLARFVHAYDDPPSWISTSLLGVPEEYCRSYGWGEDTSDEDDEERVEVEPFLSFGERQRCRLSAREGLR